MGRKRIHPSAAERQRSYRQGKRQAAGLPAALSIEQQRALDRKTRAGEVAAIRRNLIEKCGERGRELADKLYPSAPGAT